MAAPNMHEMQQESEEAEHFCEVIEHFRRYEEYHTRHFERALQQIDEYVTREDQRRLQTYAARMQQAINAIHQNANFIEKIVEQREVFHRETYEKIQYEKIEEKMKNSMRDDPEKHSKVRSTIKSIYRDWSKEGKNERDMCYGPMLRELQRLVPITEPKGNNEATRTPRVYVPGAGAARLVYETAKLGYYAVGCEFSYFMLIASFYMVNVATEPMEIFPFVHETRNWLYGNDQLRSVMVPDIDQFSNIQGQLSMQAGDFLEITNTPEYEGAFEAVLACFFLDCSPDILRTLRTIHRILKPGGLLIHFGPLTWHFTDSPQPISLDLAWDELKEMLPSLGFEVIVEQTKQRSLYTVDANSMMQQFYECVLAVIRKL